MFFQAMGSIVLMYVVVGVPLALVVQWVVRRELEAVHTKIDALQIRVDAVYRHVRESPETAAEQR